MAGTARAARDRVGSALLALATAAGVVVGLNGPATSPVAPGAPPVSVVSGLLGRLADGPAEAPGPDRRRR